MYQPVQTTLLGGVMICDECQGDVHRADAVLRGNGHRQVAWHLDCWVLRGIRMATMEAAIDGHMPKRIGGGLVARLRRIRG